MVPSKETQSIMYCNAYRLKLMYMYMLCARLPHMHIYYVHCMRVQIYDIQDIVHVHVLGVLPSIPKACRPNKPSVRRLYPLLSFLEF